jgi:periplasmic divalent cation tolerance protein
MGGEESEYCIAMTTTADEATALALARRVVEEHLAACVQIVAVRSVFVWEGELTSEDERLLLVKTRSDRYAELERLVREQHPYEVPELIRVPVTGGLGAYLAWMDESTA